MTEETRLQQRTSKRDTNGKCWSLGCSGDPETDVHVPGDDLHVTVCEWHAELFTSAGPWEVSEEEA